MTAVQFLAEWALRSSLPILTGTMLLWALRVKDPSIRLIAWTAMLCGSLAIPALTPVLPGVPLAIQRAATPPSEELRPVSVAPSEVTIAQPQSGPPTRPDWRRTAVTMYFLRLCRSRSQFSKPAFTEPRLERNGNGIARRC